MEVPRSSSISRCGGFLKYGYPQIILILDNFRLGFPMTSTIQLLGIPHDYGNPHMFTLESLLPGTSFTPIGEDQFHKFDEFSIEGVFAVNLEVSSSSWGTPSSLDGLCWGKSHL